MINEVDLNTMTPIDCMLKLRELKNLIPWPLIKKGNH
jgi:hypothetical protein